MIEADLKRAASEDGEDFTLEEAVAPVAFPVSVSVLDESVQSIETSMDQSLIEEMEPVADVVEVGIHVYYVAIG